MREYSYVDWVQCGMEGLYLDPACPDVREHVARICAEIADKYDIAGIHLDFIRYPGTLWGLPFNDTTALFAVIDGNCLLGTTFLRYARLSFIRRWLTWHYWRQSRDKPNAINETVKAIRLAMNRPEKKKLSLSAAVFPNPALSSYRYAQNWETWQGIIDYPLAMAYTTNTGLYAQLHNYCQDKFPGAIMGIGLIWPEMKIEANVQYFHTLDSRTGTDTAGSNKAFMDFLSSLSLDPEQDLIRMDLSYQQYVSFLAEDIIAFRNLDRHVFMHADAITLPPIRHAVYSITLWNKEDTMQTIKSAPAISEFTDEAVFYPEALNELGRAVFEAKLNLIDTCITRHGIYTFKVIKIETDDGSIALDSIPAQYRRSCLGWHLINRAKTLIPGK